MSVTEDIKARVEIVELVQSYNVPLHKAGRTYKAPCPFHNERTPSFVVYPDTGTWRCFGACGEGGDIFNFVMKQEGVDFAGALGLLAQRAGVELRPRTPEQSEQDARLDRLRGLLEETARFFNGQLFAPPGKQALSYIEKRGLSRETIAQFVIGFAPDDWREALTHLQALGYAEDDIIAAGVATRNDKGHVYDRFRNRLVIPIRDGRGQVIGFGARALDPEDTPKYLNSPQTPLFDKSHTLFALDAARRAIRESETAVIVEGYMDALQAHQAGFSNVVAQMGTALTEAQLKQLARYAKRLILALDPDAAGINATLRGLNVARQTLGDYKPVFDANAVLRQTSKLDIDIRVMTLPDGQDPDDLIRDEPDRWLHLVNTAQPILDYIITAGTAQVTPQTSLADREQIGRDLLPALLESEYHTHASVQKLAFKLRINEQDLMALAQRQRAAQPALPTASAQQRAVQPSTAAPRTVEVRTVNVQPSTPALTGVPKIYDMESYCLATLLEFPELWSIVNRTLAQIAGTLMRDKVFSALSTDDFLRSDYRAIVQIFREAIAQDQLEPTAYLRQNLPVELQGEIDYLMGGPLGSLRHSGTLIATEIESLLEETVRKTYLSSINIAGDLLEASLQLRIRRLKRESDEIYFEQFDGNNSETLIEQAHRIRNARLAIEKALRQFQQTRDQLETAAHVRGNFVKTSD